MPAPLGPVRKANWPPGMSKLTSERAAWPPGYRLLDVEELDQRRPRSGSATPWTPPATRARSPRGSARRTRRGSARPPDRFITWPTKKPRSWSLPARSSAACAGCSAIADSTQAASCAFVADLSEPEPRHRRRRLLAALPDGGEHLLGGAPGDRPGVDQRRPAPPAAPAASAAATSTRRSFSSRSTSVITQLATALGFVRMGARRGSRSSRRAARDAVSTRASSAGQAVGGGEALPARPRQLRAARRGSPPGARRRRPAAAGRARGSSGSRGPPPCSAGCGWRRGAASKAEGLLDHPAAALEQRRSGGRSRTRGRGRRGGSELRFLTSVLVPSAASPRAGAPTRWRRSAGSPPRGCRREVSV